MQGDADFRPTVCYGDGNVCRCDITPHGPDAEWAGPVLGICSEDPDTCVIALTLAGTSACEGSAFVAMVVEQGGLSPLNGVIHEGPGPPVPRIEWPQ